MKIIKASHKLTEHVNNAFGAFDQDVMNSAAATFTEGAGDNPFDLFQCALDAAEKAINEHKSIYEVYLKGDELTMWFVATNEEEIEKTMNKLVNGE